MKSSNYILTILCFLFLGCYALPASAQENKVIKVYRNGEVIDHFDASEIDYIEVTDVAGGDVTSGEINGHAYVDLGLPSGLKWATCNIGAIAPTNYGDYFGWGETAPSLSYTSEYCLTYGKSFADLKSQNIIDAEGNLTSTFDAAATNWKGTWRMPTKEECDELSKNCTWSLTTVEDVVGYKVVGPNGNSIFLPEAGQYDENYLQYAGNRGIYWTSSIDDVPENPIYASIIVISEFGHGYGSNMRQFGCSIRPVSK